MSSQGKQNASIAQDILEGIGDAISYMNNEPESQVIVHKIPVPDVSAIRSKLNLSQEDFAERFHIPTATLRNWEQGRRVPETSACLLLKMIEKEPHTVERLLSEQ
jgi:putative transcriptional regulator